jgi:hypothetical protein
MHGQQNIKPVAHLLYYSFKVHSITYSEMLSIPKVLTKKLPYVIHSLLVYSLIYLFVYLFICLINYMANHCHM